MSIRVSSIRKFNIEHQNVQTGVLDDRQIYESLTRTLGNDLAKQFTKFEEWFLVGGQKFNNVGDARMYRDAMAPKEQIMKEVIASVYLDDKMYQDKVKNGRS